MQKTKLLGKTSSLIYLIFKSSFSGYNLRTVTTKYLNTWKQVILYFTLSHMFCWPATLVAIV